MKQNACMVREPVSRLKRPTAEDFGATLVGGTESYFGDVMVLLHANSHMLRHTLGAGTPHRMQDIRLCFHEAGDAECSVNLMRKHLGAGVLEFYGNGSIFQLHEVSDDISLVELLISSDAIGELMFGKVPPMFQCRANYALVELNAEEQECYKEMIALLHRMLGTGGEASPVVRGLLYSILHYALGLLDKRTELVGNKRNRQSIVFHEFSRLLAQSDGKQRRLGYYARQLNVTEHYLSMAVKQMSGSTPKEFIDSVVVAEIKVLLRYSDLTVQQIAYRLDIASESFLCRFFRRMTGFTPLEYRNKALG
ncbi:MAG: helix-turn-helix domain-containing protein [Bacteroidaceae bacterium]